MFQYMPDVFFYRKDEHDLNRRRLISQPAEALHKKRGQNSKLAGKRQNNLKFSFRLWWPPLCSVTQ